uniref:Secreted protein n=1 Tax=Ixodes scapularis TaxID=6945 RepID=A0A4D5RY86_IXOSC
MLLFSFLLLTECLMVNSTRRSGALSKILEGGKIPLRGNRPFRIDEGKINLHFWSDLPTPLPTPSPSAVQNGRCSNLISPPTPQPADLSDDQ